MHVYHTVVIATLYMYMYVYSVSAFSLIRHVRTSAQQVFSTEFPLMRRSSGSSTKALMCHGLLLYLEFGLGRTLTNYKDVRACFHLQIYADLS